MKRERTDAIRARERDYKRRQSAAASEARNLGARVCQKKLGRYGICAGALDTFVDDIGRVRVVCQLCERRSRGICRECHQPVFGKVGKAIRCAMHVRLAQRQHFNRYRQRNRVRLNVAQRMKARAWTDERRAKENEARRLWRLANPDKVKAMRVAADANPSPARLAHLVKQRFRNRLDARERRRRPAALRTCLTPGCDIVLTGRKKKCTRCKQRIVQAAREALRQRAAA